MHVIVTCKFKKNQINSNKEPEDQWPCKRSPDIWAYCKYKNNFRKRHSRKIGQGQLKVIIYINFVELEYIMLHVKFQDHRTKFCRRFLSVLCRVAAAKRLPAPAAKRLPALNL